jgi:hypothetical protein
MAAVVFANAPNDSDVPELVNRRSWAVASQSLFRADATRDN